METYFFIWNANKVPEIASRSWLICDVAAAHFPFEMNFAKKFFSSGISTWITFLGGLHENHK